MAVLPTTLEEAIADIRTVLKIAQTAGAEHAQALKGLQHDTDEYRLTLALRDHYVGEVAGYERVLTLLRDVPR